MKPNSDAQQISLLPLLDSADVVEKVVESANDLLDMLNDGRKASEHYFASDFRKLHDYYILAAINKQRELLYNVLNDEGKIPEGFSANWRTIHHIILEVGE